MPDGPISKYTRLLIMLFLCASSETHNVIAACEHVHAQFKENMLKYLLVKKKGIPDIHILET